MFISDFDYDLPDSLIAQYPLTDRRGSRLLVVADGIDDRRFSELPALLRAGARATCWSLTTPVLSGRASMQQRKQADVRKY